MKNYKHWLNPVIFGVFILSMTVGLLFFKDRDFSSNEKRYLTQRSDIPMTGFLDGSTQHFLECWTEDQFPMRDGYVGLNAYWILASGRNAVQDIYHAKDGYLINAPKAEDLSVFQTNLDRFNEFAETNNIPAEMILVPSTGYLKEALLPKGHLPYPDNDAFAIAQESLTNVKFYDFRDTLTSADLSSPVCYRTDHHLTAWGNYVLYDAYCQDHGITSKKHTFTVHDNFYGTTWSGSGYWYAAPDVIQTWDTNAPVTVTITDSGKTPVRSDSLFFPSHLEELDKYPVYLDGNHTLVEIENPDAPEGTLLILKDSYAHCFTAFLAEHYRSIYMIDLRYYRDSVSQFIQEHDIDSLLYYYGVDTLLTDTNSAWLR